MGFKRSEATRRESESSKACRSGECRVPLAAKSDDARLTHVNRPV